MSPPFWVPIFSVRKLPLIINSVTRGGLQIIEVAGSNANSFAYLNITQAAVIMAHFTARLPKPTNSPNDLTKDRCRCGGENKWTLRHWGCRFNPALLMLYFETSTLQDSYHV